MIEEETKGQWSHGVPVLEGDGDGVDANNLSDIGPFRYPKGVGHVRQDQSHRDGDGLRSQQLIPESYPKGAGSSGCEPGDGLISKNLTPTIRHSKDAANNPDGYDYERYDGDEHGANVSYPKGVGLPAPPSQTLQ